MILRKNFVFINILIFLLSAVLFTSCSFNSIYLQPDKIPAQAKKASYRDGSDSISVYFNGPTHQPLFIKNRKDTLFEKFTVESMLFKSSENQLLNGWFIKPKNLKPKATIIVFHGNAGCLLSQFQFTVPLVERGLQVFIFDYSGFGFSEGKATRKNVLADGLAALDFVKTIPEVSATKLVIYGQSLGGHLSAVVGTKRQSEIDALVIEGAFSSHDDIAAKSAGFFGRLIVKELYSAKKAIRDFHKPLLVIHSTEDATVPFYMGKTIYENGNEPKSFYEIKGKHIMGPILYGDSIASKINQMLKLNQ